MGVTVLAEFVTRIRVGDLVEVAWRHADGTIVTTRQIVQGGKEPGEEVELLFVQAIGHTYILRYASGLIPVELLRVTLVDRNPNRNKGPMPRDPRTIKVEPLYKHDSSV